MNIEGLITIPSEHPVAETMDRLEVALKAKGVTIFARVDHAAGAASVQMPLRPTQLLIFGNPKGGTPLMQAAQTIGIDLPLKALAWKMPTAKAGSPTTIPRGWRSGMVSAQRPMPRFRR